MPNDGLRNANLAEVQAAFPQLQDLQEVDQGGQKHVYKASLQGQPLALKLLANPRMGDHDTASDLDETDSETLARARREVNILGSCQSPHLVKLGPIPLHEISVGGVNVIAFTEEWIEGETVKHIVRQHGVLPLTEVVKLGTEVLHAIAELSANGRLHRDVKPANIMRRLLNGDYVLLDLGIAFDLSEESITQAGMIPGTVPYLSPERLNLAKKRSLDFRSDLFSLGIVLYEAATGVHPFMRSGNLVSAISHTDPAPPSSIVPDLGSGFDTVCLRLLAKAPHARYRSCEIATAALLNTDPGESER